MAAFVGQERLLTARPHQREALSREDSDRSEPNSPRKLIRSPKPVFVEDEKFTKKDQRRQAGDDYHVPPPLAKPPPLQRHESQAMASPLKPLVQPPPPPSKGSSPVSRVFHEPPAHRSTSPRHVMNTPRIAGSSPVNGSGLSGNVEALLLPSTELGSPVYDPTKNQSYFEQCYQIISKIGQGSFGDVYKVRRIDDGGIYAVKASKLHARGLADLGKKLQEVYAALQLGDHPTCLHYYCAWEQDGRLYIQTELCEMSLAAYVERHDFTEEFVWSVLADTAYGLDHIHSHNLLHLDIKPDNLLVSADRTVKYGDFGSSIEMTIDEQFRDEGDPKYMALELLSNEYTFAADIFSLGMTLLEICSDVELPSNGPLWNRLREDNIPDELFTNVSRELQDVIVAMLSHDPRRRPSVKALLEHPRVSPILFKKRILWPIRRGLAWAKSWCQRGWFWWKPVDTQPAHVEIQPSSQFERSAPSVEVESPSDFTSHVARPDFAITSASPRPSRRVLGTSVINANPPQSSINAARHATARTLNFENSDDDDETPLPSPRRIDRRLLDDDFDNADEDGDGDEEEDLDFSPRSRTGRQLRISTPAKRSNLLASFENAA